MTKCAICRDVYTKWSMSQKVCGKIECAQAQAKKVIERVTRKAEKAERAKTRSDLLDAKRPVYWRSRLKFYLHRYIRLRDKGLPCISCGTPMQDSKYGGSVDAGHFRSVKTAKHLEFEPRNINAQCKNCNGALHGNYGGYRQGMIVKYGEGEVEWLEADQRPRKYTSSDLKELIALYKRKYEELVKCNQPQK